jgi:hypothetical protein
MTTDPVAVLYETIAVEIADPDDPVVGVAIVSEQAASAFFELPEGTSTVVDPSPVVIQGSVGPAGPRGPAGPQSDQYSIAISALGPLGNAEVIARHVFATAVTFPDDLVGSYATADVPSAGTAVLRLTRNGVEVATATFAAGATATFASGGPIEFQPGDVLRVLSPTPPDLTLTDVSLTLLGVRTGP